MLPALIINTFGFVFSTSFYLLQLVLCWALYFTPKVCLCLGILINTNNKILTLVSHETNETLDFRLDLDTFFDESRTFSV